MHFLQTEIETLNLPVLDRKRACFIHRSKQGTGNVRDRWCMVYGDIESLNSVSQFTSHNFWWLIEQPYWFKARFLLKMLRMGPCRENPMRGVKDLFIDGNYGCQGT